MNQSCSMSYLNLVCSPGTSHWPIPSKVCISTNVYEWFSLDNVSMSSIATRARYMNVCVCVHA